MTDTVVCKALVSAAPTGQHGPGSKNVSMSGVWHGSAEAQRDSENAIFGAATPVFHLSMAIANPEAAAFFVTGDQVYVTFSKERLDPTAVDSAITQIQTNVQASFVALEKGNEAKDAEIASLQAQLAAAHNELKAAQDEVTVLRQLTVKT